MYKNICFNVNISSETSRTHLKVIAVNFWNMLMVLLRKFNAALIFEFHASAFVKLAP